MSMLGITILTALVLYGESPGGSMPITGRAVSCAGFPLPGVTVTLSTGSSTVTASDGTFAFTDAPESALNVTATLAGFEPAIESICPERDGRKSIELVMPIHVIDDCIPLGRNRLPRAQDIKGLIKDLNDRPIQGAIVRIISVTSPATRFTTTTRRSGAFRKRRVRNGAYRLEVEARGYARKTLQVWLAPCSRPCEEGAVVLRLSPACGSRTRSEAAAPDATSQSSPDRAGCRMLINSGRGPMRRRLRANVCGEQERWLG